LASTRTQNAKQPLKKMHYSINFMEKGVLAAQEEDGGNMKSCSL
jgi:hypothetical protein